MGSKIISGCPNNNHVKNYQMYTWLVIVQFVFWVASIKVDSYYWVYFDRNAIILQDWWLRSHENWSTKKILITITLRSTKVVPGGDPFRSFSKDEMIGDDVTGPRAQYSSAYQIRFSNSVASKMNVRSLNKFEESRCIEIGLLIKITLTYTPIVYLSGNYSVSLVQ